LATFLAFLILGGHQRARFIGGIDKPSNSLLDHNCIIAVINQEFCERLDPIDEVHEIASQFAIPNTEEE
jgi:hypothetical protein